MPKSASEDVRRAPREAEVSFPDVRLPWIWLSLAILMATFAAYSPALRGKFLWDDDANITKPELRSMDGLARIWFEPGATSQYYPILHTAFWLEHRCWGDSPAGYHVITILWHAGAAGLFFALLRRLKMPGATLAAFVFALHPVCVESVAWIAEQKNTLSTLLYLGAALAYLRFREEPRSFRIYVAASGLFLLALLSKSVTASLPAALLVVFWWQRGGISWRDDVRPLLPWFAMACAVGLFTAWVERRFIGAEGASFDLTLPERCIVAGRAVWFYFAKLIWPADLVFIYPKWEIDAHDGWSYLPLLAAIVALVVLWLFRRRNRGALAAALLFVGTLFPVLGFLNVYGSLFSYVTDHWQYLPCLAVIAALAAGVARLIDVAPSSWRRIMSVFALIGLPGIPAVLTWRQCHNYRDAIALYESVLAANPQCRMAHNNLGVILAREGNTGAAIQHFQAALAGSPDYAKAHLNLADALAGSGRPAEALAHYAAATRYEPANAGTHSNYGNALAENGQLEAAIREFRLAIMLGSSDAATHSSLGTALFQAGHADEALAQYAIALRIAADFVPARRNLGTALFTLGRTAEALEQYEAWLRLEPRSADAHHLAGIALAKLGRWAEARTRFEEAAELNPADPEIREHLNRLRTASERP